MGGVFHIGKRQICKKSTKLPVQTLLFSCLKLVSSRVRCAVKILKDFTEGNLRKSQIKPQKSKNHISLRNKL